MKRARFLVLLISLVAAGVAAYLARGLSTPSNTVDVVEVKTQIDTVEVLVASSDIGLGSQIAPKHLVWRAWPKSQIGEFINKIQSPEAIAELKGAVVRSALVKGEPISKKKLVQLDEGGVMSALLSSGMRAVSVEIKERTVAGGFILPNDRVDVIVTRRARGATGNSHASSTILENIRVLAIGQTIETDKEKTVATGRTVTLELLPHQAELLTLADAMGDISLSLRSLVDSSAENQKDDANNPFKQKSNSSVRLLKYGVSSTAYGVQ